MTTQPDNVVATQLIIDGDWRPASDDSTYDVHNPARPSELVGRAASGTAADVDLAVDAARRAFAPWAALSYNERAQHLTRVAEVLTEDAEELASRARLFTREHGKVLKEAQMEVARLGDRFLLCASLAERLAEDEHLTGPPFDTIITRQPRGVAALITPWNWPLSILGAKLPQALIAGNTVVIKLARSASLAPAQTVRRIAQVLPAGVINLVTGSGREVGEAMLTHPGISKINFTGGIDTGRHVMAAAAPTLKHVTLELGGNDPGLVLDDADLGEESLRRMAMSVFLTSGQVCMALKRIYVHRSRYRELVDGLSEVVDQHVIGDGLDPQVTMGPLNNAAQLDVVRRMAAEAVDRRATVRELGTVSDQSLFDQGYFHRPAVITDVDASFEVVKGEQFGPLIPIMPFDTDDQAVEMANDSEFGLCSSIWTADRDRAIGLARRLEAGYTYLNSHGPTAQDSRAPFGGFKQSGLGRNLGFQGVLEFLEDHSISAAPGWLHDS